LSTRVSVASLGRVDLGCELAGHLGDLGVADGESLELAAQFL